MHLNPGTCPRRAHNFHEATDDLDNWRLGAQRVISVLQYLANVLRAPFIGLVFHSRLQAMAALGLEATGATLLDGMLDSEQEASDRHESEQDNTNTSSNSSSNSNSSGNEDDDDEAHTDPDAQTTVNDFLDFTEYLPSDMMRSLTLIGSLDETYIDASSKLHELTKAWGELPNIPANERPAPVKLRADISEQMGQALNARVHAHAEAVRMSENVNRHYNKATTLLSKLRAMMDNYPTEEEQALSPVASRSPQLTRSKPKVSDGGQKARQRRMPKITVPGEVLAPYDIAYDSVTDGSGSSDDNDGTPALSSRTPATAPRIKLVANNRPTPKPSARPPRDSSVTAGPSAEEISANQAALLKPPPPDAQVGSSDAPWLQLTHYELAKLRKRMKKNATWTPSETMVARELKALGRGPEDYRSAKKRAEDEGKSFEPSVPAPVVVDSSGAQQLPAGAISAEAVAADELPTSNRGMKLNEAKKLKREALAKLAAEEAEESAKQMAAAAKLIFKGNTDSHSAETTKDTTPLPPKSRTNSRSHAKRKRDTEGDIGSEPPEGTDTPVARPVIKRTKTETPVPPPRYGSLSTSTVEANPNPPNGYGGNGAPPFETPVPLPIPYQSSSNSSVVGTAKSPTPIGLGSTASTITTTVPIKAPATETPVPLPRSSDRRKSMTPVIPPVPTTEGIRRETRADAAKRSQQQYQEGGKAADSQKPQLQAPDQPTRRASSRGHTPGKSTAAAEAAPNGRPGSRGKTMSQEPQPSLAIDRPRRASTARNTPAPEPRPPSRRGKRPAPGVVSTTRSGGSSAVGKRKAAPRKKARATRREKDQQVEIEMEDVDDEGNPIDPNETKYCVCNRVSFGTMIRCDNADNTDVSRQS